MCWGIYYEQWLGKIKVKREYFSIGLQMILFIYQYSVLLDFNNILVYFFILGSGELWIVFDQKNVIILIFFFS